MISTRCRRLFLTTLSALVFLPVALAAQTIEENDSSAREARQENGLPLITTRNSRVHHERRDVDISGPVA